MSIESWNALFDMRAKALQCDAMRPRSQSHRVATNDEARGIVVALMSAGRPGPARKRKIKLLGPRLVFITPHPITPPLFVNAALKYQR